MALIEFDFLPLEALPAFGGAHWFGLTDARFCLRVGEQALFERAPAGADGAAEVDRRIDHQLARLHADLLGQLPDVLEPVPKSIASRIETLDAQLAWLHGIEARHATMPEEDDDAEDAWWLATGWLQGARRLDTGWLRDMPAIWLLRIDDAVHLRWHANDASEARRWSATSGEHVLPVDRFRDEVRDFHTRLMDGMAERIDALDRRAAIDREAFERDQEQARQLLGRAFEPHPDPTDWTAVDEAIRFLAD